MDHLTFQPWPDPTIDTVGSDPTGTYSRLAWLPIIGPSSWLVWGTIATQLRADPRAVWELVALAEAHGLHSATGPWGTLRRTLARLAHFRLFLPVDDTHHLVRLSAPPVTRRQLDRLPGVVAELHATLFSETVARHE